MSDASASGLVLAADGSPLKRSLARALRRQKLRALALITPLLLFVLITFIVPIASMLFRSVQNDIVVNTLPYTVQSLASWNAETDNLTFRRCISICSLPPKPNATPGWARG